MYDIQHCFICRPSDFTVSEDAGIEHRTVATTALAVRRSNHCVYCIYLDHRDPQTIQIVVDLLEQVQGLQGVLPTTLVCNGCTLYGGYTME
jgi:hypothetical protein